MNSFFYISERDTSINLDHVTEIAWNVFTENAFVTVLHLQDMSIELSLDTDYAGIIEIKEYKDRMSLAAKLNSQVTIKRA